MVPSIQALLTGLIDYAGLFPPAKLAMQPAVENYNRYRVGEREWMLGRFICPVSRLDEFTRAASALLPGTYATSGYREWTDMEPWPVSAIIDGDLKADLVRIEAFNDHHAETDRGLALIDSIELKAATPASIDGAIDLIPEEIFPFFEFPVAGDPRGFVAALAGNDAAAKIRTGGLHADAFPGAAGIAAFLHACSAADVPFKATAGLHHPVRATYPYTYEPAGECGAMHGFLNLFIAAALVRARKADLALAVAILEDEDPKSFRTAEETVAWRDLEISVTQLAACRESFALSYGSCSFDEPVEELTKLGLL